MKEKILEILEEENDEIITYTGDNLVQDGILDSISLISIIGELEDAFDIEIDAKFVVEQNFKSKEAIIKLVETLVNEI